MLLISCIRMLHKSFVSTVLESAFIHSVVSTFVQHQGASAVLVTASGQNTTMADFSNIVQSYSNATPTNIVFFQLVIAALKCHKYDKSIQVTGSAALYYLTNTEYRSDQSVRLRREVIQVVLNGMEHYQEVTVSVHHAS